jgi:hypothetical protein
MRKKRIKELRKKYKEKYNEDEVMYNLRGQIVEGKSWRRFKKEQMRGFQ